MRRWALVLLLWTAAAMAQGDGKKDEERADSKPAKVPADNAARRLFLARCSSCHAPNRVRHRQATRDEWREIVDRMRRMPQSGIAPDEAKTILDYLVRHYGRNAEPAPPAAAGAPPERLGGRSAYGSEWLSVLEIATVTDGKARLGGRVWSVERDGLEAVLRAGDARHVVSLTRKGRAGRTARLDAWRVGDAARYEVHLVLYEIRAGRTRVALALRRS